MNQEDFGINHSDSTEGNFERFLEIFTENRRKNYFGNFQPTVTAIREYWVKLTEEEKWKFLDAIRGREIYRLPQQAADPFNKAKDYQLKQAAKCIEENNIAKLATKYLGLSSKLISGRDVFSVLKLWRDAMPYQGSKQVGTVIPTTSCRKFSKFSHVEEIRNF